MTFEISPSILSPILATMAKLVGSKPIMPILENVKFYEQDGHYLITIISGDQETTLTAALPLENVEIFHPMLVPVNELSRMVKAAEGSIFPLTFKTCAHNGCKSTDRNLCIDYGEGEYQLLYKDVTEYPTQNIGQPSGILSLPTSIVPKLVQATAFVGRDDLRPVMMYVMLDVRANGDTRVAATDSKTLFVTHVADVKADADTSVLLSVRTIGLISQLLPSNGSIQLQKSDKFVIIRLLSPEGNTICRIDARMFEGRFPRYDAVIPKDHRNVITFDAQQLQKAIDRASVCADSERHLRFDIVKGEQYVSIKAEDIDMSRNASTSVGVKSQQIDCTTAFGLREDYLTRCIRAVGTKELSMTYSDPNHSCLINSSDGMTTALIMPYKLNQ